MATRKTVTSEQYDTAYKNRDNRKVIESVTGRYIKVIDRDDLTSAGMTALLRCLEYHDNSFNQKFTTSLWRFTDWECKRVLRSKKNKPQAMQLSVIDIDTEDKNTLSDDGKFVKECIQLLQPPDQEILRMYYYEDRTMEEIGKLKGFSKESARQKINKSLKKLEDILTKENSK